MSFQRLMAGSGVELLNTVEQVICGSGAVESPMLAQGLALAGGRVANLLGEEDFEAPTSLASLVVAPWVYHHIMNSCGGRILTGAFELIPGSLQEAVDQCLVAHSLAEHLGEPGICQVDSILLNRLGLALLPSQALANAILGSGETGLLPSAGRLPAQPTDVLRAAKDAFDRVSEGIDRRVGPMSPYLVDDARFLIVTLGWISARSRLAVDLLRKVGIPIGVVSVGMIRPFPVEQMGRLLQDRQSILVIDFEPPSDGVATDFFHQVRSTLADQGLDSTHCVPMSCPGPDHTVRELATLIGFLIADSKVASLPPLEELRTSNKLTVGTAPGGTWGRSLLLELATLLGRERSIELQWVNRNLSELSALLIRPPHSLPVIVPHSPMDLVLLPHPALLASTAAGAEIVEGGTLIIRARAAVPEELWSALGEMGRSTVKSQRLQVWWVDAIGLSAGSERPNEAAKYVFLGAALAAAQQTEAYRMFQEPSVDNPLGSLPPAHSEEEHFEAFWLAKGASAALHLDLESIESFEVGREPDHRQSPELPRMPSAPPEGDHSEWSLRLRRFHLNAEATRGLGDAYLGLPLRPAMIPARTGPSRLDRHYPIFIPKVPFPSGSTIPLKERLERAFADLESSGVETSILRHHLARLIGLTREVLREHSGAMTPRKGIQEACTRFAQGFDLSEQAQQAMAEQLAALQDRLTEDGELIGFGPQTALRLLITAVAQQRRGRQERFRADVHTLVQRLQDLLWLERSHLPEASSPEALAVSLGETGLIDLEALARTLPSPRGPKPLEPDRKRRIEGAYEVLSRYLEESKEAPQYILLHAEPLPAGVSLPGGIHFQHPDACAIAMGLFDGLAYRMLDVFRAIRLAHLELEDQYDADIHDELLAGLTWQSCRSEELLAMTPVLVLEQATWLRQHSLADFSQLLRSGRLIQVLLEESTVVSKSSGARDTAIDLHSGLGMMAVAHREAFVAQTTLARPFHLLASLERMLQVSRPALTVVAVPDFRGATWPPLIAEAALDGRATPCFRYDPDRGTRWAKRFDLEGNPQCDRIWPRASIPIRNGEEGEASLDQAVTFADVAALDSAYRKHFWVVPLEAYSDEQVDLDTYLSLPGSQPHREIPYVWVVDEEGWLRRAVLTRELTLICQDYKQAWQTLQELGGVSVEAARRAAGGAPVQQEPGRAEDFKALAEEYQEKVERVRVEAASQAIDRLVQVLLNIDAAATAPRGPGRPAAIAPTAAGPPGPQAAPPAESRPAPREDKEEVISLDKPYIDSFLCTSCHDCIELNPLLFNYNANKQAYIADPRAGTFAELVQAAVKCPARCIHPGKPRPGDPTVTEDLLKRAKQFA